MSEQITTQITFRGQTIDATVLWVDNRQFLIAAVPGILETTAHFSEEQEVVVLDDDAGDRPIKFSNIETMASFRDRLFADS